MKIICFNDIHRYAPNEIKVKLEYGPNVYYLGDIFDLKNCRKDMVPFVREELRTSRFKARYYVSGNHDPLESGYDPDVMFIITNGKPVIFSHGDEVSWGREKARGFRRKSNGASVFHRNIVVPIISWYERTIGRTPSKADIQRAVSMAKAREATTHIMGHYHPKETYDQVHDGVRIVILKRGRNEVEI